MKWSGAVMSVENLNDIKISVIVPVYNIGERLKRCVESIRGQTHGNLEIILVDDGSTDTSAAVCDEYSRTDTRVRVVHKENGGPASARRAGLEIATGQYIGFVDGDDYVDAEMYGYLLRQLYGTQADFIHSGFYKEKGEAKSLVCNFKNEIYNVQTKKLEFLKEHILTDDKEYMHPSMCTKLFRANLIKESHRAVPDDLTYGEDLVNLLSCVFHADAVATCDKSFYHYVFREHSIMNGVSQRLEWEFRLHRELSAIFAEHGYIGDIKKYLDCSFYNQILEALKLLDNRYLCVSQYCVRETDAFRHKKVVIYGAGNVGIDLYQQLCRIETCDVVAMVDKNFSDIHLDYVTVRDVGELPDMEYDMILLAVKYYSVADKIRESLARLGIDQEKIVWKCPHNVFDAQG